MVRIFFSVVGIFLITGTMAQTSGPVITWEKSTHDFGDVHQGDKVEHTFKFRNTGNEALIITNIQVTCGCTVPKGWARDPIPPGQSGEVTIAFNSTGLYGRKNKVVSIVSNTTNPDGAQLLFTANVIEKRVP